MIWTMKSYYNSLFISDVHFGFKHSQGEELHNFLKGNDFENLYLVGDIIDFWMVSDKGNKFKKEQRNAAKYINDLRRDGVNVIYVPGNHDMNLRLDKRYNMFLPQSKIELQRILDEGPIMDDGGLPILIDTVHKTNDGRNFRVAHGDEFDEVIRVVGPWLAKFGSHMYDLLLDLNPYLKKTLGVVDDIPFLSEMFDLFGFNPHFSLSAYAKKKVKLAGKYIGGFEELAIMDLARRNEDIDKSECGLEGKLSGLIFGHIHQAEIKYFPKVDGVETELLYLNCGDWVESMAALAEDRDGSFMLLNHRGELIKREGDDLDVSQKIIELNDIEHKRVKKEKKEKNKVKEKGEKGQKGEKKKNKSKKK